MSEKQAVQFIPVRGLDKNISNEALNPITDGYVYFATDSGKIYVDSRGERVIMGAAGAAIYYGTLEKPTEVEGYFDFPVNAVSGTPKVGDLILNSDGGFYKVQNVNKEIYTCIQVSVSGTGDGSGIVVGRKQPTCEVTVANKGSFINGRKATFHIDAESAKDASDKYIDTTLYVYYELYSADEVRYYTSPAIAFRTKDEDYEGELGKINADIEFQENLQPSRTSILKVWVEGRSHDIKKSSVAEEIVTSSVLILGKESGWKATTHYPVSGFELKCTVEGSVDKIVEFYYDDMKNPKETKYIAKNVATATPTFYVSASEATHGHHTVKFILYQNLGTETKPKKGQETEPIQYEIAVIDNTNANAKPVIWLDPYQSTYYNYDSIQIYYYVYDPQNTAKATVHLYKDKVEIQGSPHVIEDFTKPGLFEISDAIMGRLNSYQLSCGETDQRRVEREVTFRVEKDPERDMTILQDNLLLDFNAVGRSNYESAAKRKSWSYELKTNASDDDGSGVVKNAIFDKFTWTDKNGWNVDPETQQTRLTISNGSSLTIPFRSMEFAKNAAGKNSHTVEMQIRVRNIQKYGNLITNITRYEGDGDWYTAFTQQSEYDNYDAFLQVYLPTIGKEIDDLKFFKVQKDIQINNVVGGLYDYDDSSKTVTGFCIGTQDAFFSNGQDTVNVNFVENELTNLSFVYQHGLKLMYIYINGVITGVIRSYEGDDNASFTITNPNIVFNSKHCDIDIYKLRIYNTNLDVNQIVTNYAIDRRDVPTFDQSKKYAFASENKALQEYQISYDKIVEYNSLNRQNPTMPYIIFDTGADSLPYSKDDKKKIKVEFINAPLEAAYASGELEELAREDGLIPEGNDVDPKVVEEGVRTYYMHHCPSWTSSIRSTDLVNFEVQGTSSEFYPRRNYKVKTKMDGNFDWVDLADIDEETLSEMDADERAKVEEDGGMFESEDGLNIFMHKGPFAEMYELDKTDIAKDLEGKFAGKERTRMVDGWYMNNYTNPTDRWTMKVDYMESSGSYNAGFASIVGNAYTKHPLQDHLKNLTGTDKLKPVIQSAKYNAINWKDYRTSLLGFPVMAFQKTGSKYIFIGYYRMLLDKSSTQVLGFKPSKDVKHKMFPDGKGGYRRVRDVAECWEFSNNARGFCSYRDPWNRVELSFLSPRGETNEWTAKGAPVVANSFEYRYHSKDDYIDKLYEFNSQSQASLDEVAKELGLPAGSIKQGDKYSGADALMTTHVNWEKVCKWLWSTNLDAVVSQGTYSPVLVSNTKYETGTYYVVDSDGVDGFSISNDAFDENQAYYKLEVNDKGEKKYSPIRLCLPENLFTAVGKTWYYQVAGQNTPDDDSDDVYTIATEYNNQTDYYSFSSDTIEVQNTKLDLLVRPVDPSTDVFSSSTEYFLYDGSVKVKKGQPTGAVTKVESPVEADFSTYYVASPVTYAGTSYTHDSKEYRAAKFTNEFELHFDPEYVATYFVMTEVMELYDSRGKNCMMASWGPLDYKKNADGEYILDDNGEKIPGEYIWYPIFYDIDTQLGINNTGIPSFQFNVDATDAGNFSTSDSILWNNFYKFFKDVWMIPKYRNLRGNDSKFNKLEEITADGAIKTAPLQSVDYIEKWYTFDPEVTRNIACRGIRPKLATNLDMYFKYITICNAEAKNQGVAHLGGEGSNGAYADPDTGTYFYALQGDRSQSRRQFVESRLDYIDSWLVQGNYARAGQNRLWGRISANNRSDKDLSGKIIDVHSDKWTESGNEYWKDGIEFGTKLHEFDAEYWLEPSPIRSSYFTAGDDSMNYPSQKYDGINKLKFKLAELENGIRKSDNYPEQLLYIYGTDKMSDFGDLSKMYWTEFKIEGSADKLTRLKLGHDGLSYDTPNDSTTEKRNISWYNKKLNNITLPSKGLPLLKEANFCNITLTAEKPLDLSQSDKLENFRATGSSNITGVTFAKGVALNTLYLPSNIGTLNLDSAELLTDLIGYSEETKYEVPQNVNGNLVAKPGLYLEGFFDGESSLRNLCLKNSALGYNSYRLVKHLYDKYANTQNNAKVTLTNVNWCPYVQLGEGDIYSKYKKYYIDNGHYGFENYTNVGSNYSKDQFDIDVLSGKLYCYFPYDLVLTEDGYKEGAPYFTINAAGDEMISYAFVDIDTFNRDVLDAKIYIKVADDQSEDVLYVDDNAITMLKNLQGPNFSGAENTAKPVITGIIYVNNTTPIEETEISGALQAAYPNLTFFFKNVTEAYSARFVLIDKDTQAEGWVDHATEDGYGPSVQKIKFGEMTADNNVYFENPYALYKVQREHWVFYGWATTPSGKNADGTSSIIIGDIKEGMNEAQKLAAHEVAWKAAKATVFKADKVDYPFYAILTEDKYTATFKDTFNSNYIQTTETYYSDKNGGAFMTDMGVPAPVNHGASELYMRNTFKGWTDDEEAAKIIYSSDVDDADLPLVNVYEYPATRNYTFYAVFKQESVFNQVVSTEYFNFNEYNSGYGYVDEKDPSYTKQGCSISIKEAYKNQGYLDGKITLPAYSPDGVPVVALGSMNDNGITHIFFEQNNDRPVEVRCIAASACANATNLTYVDFANMPKLRWIMESAFNGCSNLSTWTFYDPLVSISELAFAGAGSNHSDRANLVLNPMLQNLGRRTFGQTQPFADVTFGTPTAASKLNPEDWIYNGATITNGYVIGHNVGYNVSGTVTIYCKQADKTNWENWLSTETNTSPLIILSESASGMPTYVFVN